MKNNGQVVLFIIILLFSILSCETEEKPTPINESPIDSLLIIHESAKYRNNSILFKGHFINRREEINVDYNVNEKSKYRITFTPPVTVAVAKGTSQWGYFQFPKISWNDNNIIDVTWQMKPDTAEEYGDHGYESSYSSDHGKSWKLQTEIPVTEYIMLPNGDKLSIHTPKPFSLFNFDVEPIPGSNRFLQKNLPDSLKNIYFKRKKKGNAEWKIEMAELIDDTALRYALNNYTIMPILWWGDMQIEFSDQSLVAGIYPGHYIAANGIPSPGITFYRSTDNGYSWNYLSRIRNVIVDDAGKAVQYNNYSEPAFLILPNGNYLCVIRTNEVMLGCISQDKGKTWNTPFIIGPNGVLPRLLQLENGVTVLSSGRPGLQIRFSTDKDGLYWSDPFEMLPYSIDESVSSATCGYSGLIPVDQKSFLVVYSDFKYPTSNYLRKGIVVRKIIIEKS